MEGHISMYDTGRFEELVRAVMEKDSAVGLGIAVVDKSGKTLYEKHFGFRDRDKDLPLNGDTVFMLASLSKSFVALSAMQLAESGKIDLDKPVCEYFPCFERKGVTLTHLLSHSAGYFPLRVNTNLLYSAKFLEISQEKDGDFAYNEAIASYVEKIILDKLNSEKNFIGEPGRYFSYSNIYYSLVGAIISRISRSVLPVYVKQNILEPLGMRRSAYDFLWDDDNVSSLYWKAGKTMRQTSDMTVNHDASMGWCGIKTSLNDMKKYVCMHLNKGVSLEGRRIISSSAISAMHKPRQITGVNSYYGYAFEISALDDISIIHHTGVMPGTSCNITFSQEMGIGAVILCNTTSVDVTKIVKSAMYMVNKGDPLYGAQDYGSVVWPESLYDKACGIYAAEDGINWWEIVRGDESTRLFVKSKKSIASAFPVNQYMLRTTLDGKEKLIQIHQDDDGYVWGISIDLKIIPKVNSNAG